MEGDCVSDSLHLVLGVPSSETWKTNEETERILDTESIGRNVGVYHLIKDY